jgi:hypothetical protein
MFFPSIACYLEHLYLSLLLLGAALAAPTITMAGPKPQEASVRVYDRDHREDHAYRRYLGAQRRTYLGYDRQTPEHSGKKSVVG